MTSPAGDRQDRRKAATRAAIIEAANRLFEANGFIATSLADISEAADVAVRTIYLHFDSKAAILLAYFDDWLDELTVRVCARPANEPVDELIVTVLAEMVQSGWTDNRTFEEMDVPHPILVFLGTGSPEVAGHLMQSWVRAQERMTVHFRENGDWDAGSIQPRVRSGAIFATWLTTILSYQDEFEGRLTTSVPTHELGARISRAFQHGIAAE